MAHFTDQVIVITGASSGIGRALAIELATQEPKLVLAGRDPARLDETATACGKAGAETLIAPGDLADAAQCRVLIERAIERFGRLNVLVNNAGRAMWSRFDELAELAVIEELLRVNFLAGVHTTHHALPHLKRSRGLIVAMSSISGLIGVPLLTGYSASKHAVVGFYESLRIELQDSGVDVTIAAPDFVQSEILERAIGPDGQPIQISPLDQQSLLSAQRCARRIAKAMARRRRMVFTSFRSPWSRLGQLLAPELVDRIAAASVKQKPR